MFRFSRLLNAIVNPQDTQAQRDADAELQQVKRGEHFGGIAIPPDAARALSTAASSGGGVIETDTRGEDFIDALYGQNWGLNRARTYTGLSGNVDIPAEDTVASAGWVAETGTATEQDPTMRQITLTPKRLVSYVDVSRALLMMGSTDAEELVKDMLIRAISNSLDSAIFYGTGSNDQPTGLANLTGINGDITLSAAHGKRGDKVWESLIKAEQNLADNNVDESMVESILAPSFYYTCRFHSYDGNGNEGTADSKIAILPTPDSPLLEQYPQTKSGKVASGKGLFIGDFSKCIIGQWTDGFEIMTNPYTLDTQGLVRICINSLCDIQFVHAKAFQQITVA